jgi:hypothetical protein
MNVGTKCFRFIRADLLPISLLIAIIMGCGGATQMVDPNYVPPAHVTSNPTYSIDTGPIVAIDNTHLNLHTRTGSYAPFASLLQADGYRVTDFSTPYLPQDPANPCIADQQVNPTCAYYVALSSIQTLVIANARTYISSDEAQVISAWVEAGGKLLLIADHYPFPNYVTTLAYDLGINWLSVYASKEWDTFAVTGGTAGTLAVQPITLGKDPSQLIPSVQTFTGSALQQDPNFALPKFNYLSTPILIFTNSYAGYLQGMTLEYGQGLAYLSGEAGMFTEQINLVLNKTFGMADTPYDQQYILNIMHWLGGLI